MSHFLKVLEKHQAELERLIEQHGNGPSMSYSMMLAFGMLKPFAVRLPEPLIVVLDEMLKHGMWHSKQEMVYDMIQSAMLDFFDSCPEETRKQCLDIQQKAIDAWNAKNKKKELTSSVTASAGEAKRVKVRKGKRSK